MKILEINCKVDGCDRKAHYREKAVCQKHYFRMMRRGTYETLQEQRIKKDGHSRKYRIVNPDGYHKIFEPLHPLSNQPSGYVYEHRYVVYQWYGESLPNCFFCDKELYWDMCHIDHIDKDKSNNKFENLRPLCRGCNTSREYVKDARTIEIDGVVNSVMQWSRHPDCKVSHSTITRRLHSGYSNFDAVFAPKITHKDVIAEKSQIKHNINKLKDTTP